VENAAFEWNLTSVVLNLTDKQISKRKLENGGKLYLLF
jgi:hypothetical protein